MAEYKKCIMVCGGSCCTSSHSARVAENFRKALLAHKLQNTVQVITTGCFGICGKGAVVRIDPDDIYYVSVKADDAAEIINEHIVKGSTVSRLLLTDSKTGKKIISSDDMEPYRKQLRIATRNCGVIDPEDIDDYIINHGYQALGQCFSRKPAEIIAELKKSGLRGRGGGGFPTGLKWEYAAASTAQQKYVVCNADEGDPGAFMDRSVLEGDPHSILEAMAICGYCIGADRGLVYIRAEYPLAIKRLRIALDQARSCGLIGKNIMGSDFSFDIELRLGAGAFVCGEETALIHSMEGERGEPTLKPPFPAESGFMGKPTNVNNVETFANIPVILLKGAEWFSSIGTENSKGTKVFALSGNINNVGLIEVPMGITLNEVIHEIGGGVRDGRKFKAVQTGGPSGGCLTERHLDTKIDYDTLVANGSMMGSGGMVVFDEEDCMVSLAKFYLEFTVEESCGKCTPCRIGTKRMHEILTKITLGKANGSDLSLLKTLSRTIKETSLCGLGQTAPNPVLSTLENFWNEYTDHVEEKRCTSAQCTALLTFTINAEKCIGCTACTRVCPASCISGKVREKHVIDAGRCLKCGACMSHCKVNAILKK